LDFKKQHENKLFEQANIFINAKNYDDAINVLKDLIMRNAKEAQYHSYLGLALESKGWSGYAQAEFKVALHYDPQDPLALKYYNHKNTATLSNKQTTPLVEVEQEKRKTGFFRSLFGKK